MSKKCLICKERGTCCYVSIPIEGYNIILENVRCPQLDIETGLCKDYPNRHTNPWCLGNPEMFNKGCLPRECEYLKENIIENTPKIHLGEILNDFTIPTMKKMIIFKKYQQYDQLPFEQFKNILYKKEEITV